MSRSRRKTPIWGITTASSEKDDKQIWHRRYRARVRSAIETCVDYEDLDWLIPTVKESSNPWDMNKDGKHWHGPGSWGYPRFCDSRDMRK